MELSRRALIEGLGSLGFLAAGASSAWAGEVVRRVSSVQGVGVGPGIVRILYNENPLGPSPKAIQAASAAVAGSNRYPMETIFELFASIHSLHGLSLSLPGEGADVGSLFAALDESSILLGCGSTEILRAVALAWGADGGEIVEARPGYGSVSGDAVSAYGERVKKVLIPLTPEYRHDLEAMAKAVTPATRVVVVTNPNNPTGTGVTLAEITRLADRLDPKILLLVDEAYIDFAETPGVESAVGLAVNRPNVLVSRTFSKIHGLAGLRLGYAVASKPVLRQLRPYLLSLLGINSAAVAAARASLADTEHLRRSREVALAARRQLVQKLPTFGLKPVPGDAPFTWVSVGRDCTPLVQRLARENVLIAGGQRWNLPNYVRISTGSPAEMDALFAALAAKA